MINRHNEQNFIPVLEGVEVKTTVMGEDSLMAEFHLRKGSVLPSHAHPDYEQTGFLVSGNIILTIGGKTISMNPGDSWCIRKGTEHRADIIEDSVAVEVFTCPREDYVKLLDPASE